MRTEGPLRTSDFSDDREFARPLARREPAAVERFERELLPKVDAVVRRLDDAPAFLDDVKQALRTRLDVESKSLEASSGRGPLVAWLRMAAGRIALNHLRPEKRAARADSAELDALPFGAPGPELDHAKLDSFATPPRKPDPPKGKRGKAALVPTS